jgi:superfamily II DNA or RNA helicase
MGLTATYEREDGLHSELNRLVGGKVFEKKVKSLQESTYLRSDFKRLRLH